MSLFIPKNLLEESKSDQHKNKVQPRFLCAKNFNILFDRLQHRLIHAESLSIAPRIRSISGALNPKVHIKKTCFSGLNHILIAKCLDIWVLCHIFGAKPVANIDLFQGLSAPPIDRILRLSAPLPQ